MANTFARAKSVTVENANATLSVATTVGHGPIADMSVDGDTLVVSNYGDHNVVMLDAATLAVTGGVAAREPFALVAAGGRAHVGVASANYDAVAVIDTRTGAVIRSYPLSFNVTAMAASPDGKRVYAGRAGDGGVDVSVIDTTAERVGTIYLAKGEDANIDALRVDVSGRRLYAAVSDARSSRLVVVDLETGRVRRSLEVGAPIRGLEIGLDNTAYVLTSDINDRGVVHVVDMVANRIMASAAGGHGADAAGTVHRRQPGVRRRLRPGRGAEHRDAGRRRHHLGGCAAVLCRRRSRPALRRRLLGGITAYAVPHLRRWCTSRSPTANPLAAVEIRELEPAGV